MVNRITRLASAERRQVAWFFNYKSSGPVVTDIQVDHQVKSTLDLASHSLITTECGTTPAAFPGQVNRFICNSVRTIENRTLRTLVNLSCAASCVIGLAVMRLIRRLQLTTLPHKPVVNQVAILGTSAPLPYPSPISCAGRQGHGGGCQVITEVLGNDLAFEREYDMIPRDNV